MTREEIKTHLRAIIESNEEDSIKKEVAVGALESDEPEQFLLDSYRDRGLLYSLDEYFFTTHGEAIVAILPHANEEMFRKVRLVSLPIELSYLCYQAQLEMMLIEFGCMSEEERLFTKSE